MPRHAKQLARLAVIESELRDRLIEELRRVARGTNTLFFHTSEFNPLDLPDRWLPDASAALSALASEALRLRDSLGEPHAGSVGEMFRSALHRAADQANHHRLGPVRLAQELLAELQR